MSNNNINEKSFTLVLSNVKKFALFIKNFPISTSLILSLILKKITITNTLKLRIRLPQTLTIKKIRLTYISKLLTRFVSTLSIRTVKLIMTMKVINRESSSILLRMPFVNVAKFIIRTIAPISGGFVRFVLAPTVAVLIKLTTLDPQLLSVLDVQTLNQMDHS